MGTLGIGTKLQEAIMLAEFENIRYTATCKFWLSDAIQMAYETLVHLNDRLKEDQSWIAHQKKNVVTEENLYHQLFRIQ